MRQPAPQWVNSLAIVLGGIALLAPSINPVFRYLFINFLIVGAILGFLWPERSWRWGLWLTVPAITFGLVGFAENLETGQFIKMATGAAQALIAGALMGIIGARYSPRRLPLRGLR